MKSLCTILFALLLCASCAGQQAPDRLCASPECQTDRFDRGGRDSDAFSALSAGEFWASAAERAEAENLIALASPGFRAALALPLARQAFRLPDAEHARHVFELSCRTAEGVDEGSLARDGGALLVLDLCGGGNRPGETEEVATAKKALRQWRQGQFDAAAGLLKDLAREYERTGRTPGPRRLPFRASAKAPIVLGVLLQVAGYDSFVTFGTTIPRFEDELKSAYAKLYAAHAQTTITSL